MLVESGLCPDKSVLGGAAARLSWPGGKPAPVWLACSSSGGSGNRSYNGFKKDAATISTGPAAVNAPTTLPPTTCPCPPANEIVIPPEMPPPPTMPPPPGKNAPANDKISNLPCRLTVAPGADGWRNVTFATVPLPLIRHIPLCLLRANSAIHSATSCPPPTSHMCGLIAFSLSRVIITGGLGLFFDPGGRPRGFLTTSTDPSPPPAALPAT
ncbi:hypothetical protein GOP47_0029677 [Adiantum capillus-veneris]|nr:hypothetical protein GOP47_0029677 [Adiantum capillus-veneris]